MHSALRLLACSILVAVALAAMAEDEVGSRAGVVSKVENEAKIVSAAGTAAAVAGFRCI
jgi:hypothetical protein